MEKKEKKEESKPIFKDSTLGDSSKGLEMLARRAAMRMPSPTPPPPPQPRGYAMGGPVMVDPNDVPPPAQPLPPMPPTPPPVPAPQVPQLSDVASALNRTPPTDYSFMKNLSADDRAALQQKLIAGQTSAPSMVAQGAAGLGDAISNSFGGKNTSFQKDVMANDEMQQKKALDAFDTQRQMKMQDYQTQIAMQEQDPKSDLSNMGRSLFQKMGIPVPSGMGFAQLKSVSPQLADLVKAKWEQAFKGAELAQQNNIANQGLGVRRDEVKNKEDEFKQAQRKEVSSHWLLHPVDAYRATQETARQALGDTQDNPADHGIPDLGSTFNGGKILKVTRMK